MCLSKFYILFGGGNLGATIPRKPMDHVCAGCGEEICTPVCTGSLLLLATLPAGGEDPPRRVGNGDWHGEWGGRVTSPTLGEVSAKGYGGDGNDGSGNDGGGGGPEVVRQRAIFVHSTPPGTLRVQDGSTFVPDEIVLETHSGAFVGLSNPTLWTVPNVKTDRRGRPLPRVNEDVVFAATARDGLVSVLGVCDGHGVPPRVGSTGTPPRWSSLGRQVSKLAAKDALRAVGNVRNLEALAPAEAKVALARAFAGIHDRVQAEFDKWRARLKMDERWGQGGAMVCLAVRTPLALVTVNVGDSRAVLLRPSGEEAPTAWAVASATDEVNAASDPPGAVEEQNAAIGIPGMLRAEGSSVAVGKMKTQATSAVGDAWFKTISWPLLDFQAANFLVPTNKFPFGGTAALRNLSTIMI